MGEENNEIELGGNITLSGFGDLEHMELTVVKKIVGRYARQVSDLKKDFENLKVTLKEIHKTPKSQKYEIHVQVIIGGKTSVSEVVDRNLFVALDSSLKKVTSAIEK